MTLQDLARELRLPIPNKDSPIDVIAQHPMQANEKSVFVCLKGARHDGHEHAMEAYRNGCRVFVAQSPLSLPSDAHILYVPSTRKALASLACCFFQYF